MRIVLDLQGAQSDSRFRGIGRYSLALAQAIARQAGQHDIWLALSGRFPDSIEPLRAAFADLISPDRIRVFELPGPVAELDLANAWRMQAAELLREHFLASLSPDVVHVSTLFEGLGNEVVASVGRLDATMPTAVTLYDLIPMLRPESYLTDPLRKRHYLRHAQSLKRADLLLAISESSRREAIETLHIPSIRIVNIGAGLNPCFCPTEVSPEEKAALMARFGLRRPFLLYIGGLEPRKNLKRLIAAFGLLKNDLRSEYQLAVLGSMNNDEKERLASLRCEECLGEDQIVCTSYASDEDLRLLYASCALFVFPSLHEGFGLPVLEAMACGAAVLASNCTSITEIIDREEALFDPNNPREIAERIEAVLSNGELRDGLKRWGPERARTFTWEKCAHKALEAFEELHAERKKRKVTVSLGAALGRRPLLAFVSPLPPGRTGIAGYSAQLLPSLARHYEIVCVVDQPQVSDPWIAAEFVIRDLQWFEANAARFERVVYQFGNSPSHKHMFELQDRHPGVTTLHDFYLSSALDWMEQSGYALGVFTRALYDSHGFFGLEYDRTNGRDVSIARFPCNARALRDSIGVIVHSHHAIQLACQWYNDRVSDRMRAIPFLPFPPEETARISARRRLGLPEDAFVVCSFGWIAPVKLNDRLLEAWLASPLAKDMTCYLAFVGSNHDGEYGQRLLARIATSGNASRIQITGYCQEINYRDYLAAADLAVQLRTGSRGETSAAVFDCLARGVPLVVNAHGSAAELPDDAVMKLDDNLADEELSAALARLRGDAELRRKLAARGAAYVSEMHQPEHIAELYRNTIEDFYITSSKVREENLVQAITRLSTPVKPMEFDLAQIATALALNREGFGQRQILVDVSNLPKNDLRTGIERTTRAMLMALILDPPAGYRIEPVRASAGAYRYAGQFACCCLGLPDLSLADELVETSPGDLFVGLDWCADIIPGLSSWFVAQKRRGMRLIFTIYDVLPLTQPQMFPPEIEPMVRRWLDALAELADGLVCISRTVAEEVVECLNAVKHKRLRPLRVGFFHLGADFTASLPTSGVPENSGVLLASIRCRPSFLMVGTLEPRKGYRQALAAMERLWADGVDVNLVIVGKKGWMMDDLAERIQQHPERDHRLFWLQGISDDMLQHVYRSARALLAASEAEGFGLPLIEGAQHGLPIIARDIPVFREVAGEHAYYFRGESAQALADALCGWLSLGDGAPASTGIRWLTWKQSSRKLLDVVLKNHWYRHWPTQHSGVNQRVAQTANCQISFPGADSVNRVDCATLWREH
jgi:glycosyltransferase involved in cell wall biosynthesis